MESSKCRLKKLLLLDLETGLFKGLVAEDELSSFGVLRLLHLTLALLTAEANFGAGYGNRRVGIELSAGERAMGLLGLTRGDELGVGLGGELGRTCGEGLRALLTAEVDLATLV